jgi:molybdopterin-containing oxidoreductase family membrane subunit
MGSPKSAVGWFTLAGGITGFLTGFLLAIFTATRWNLIVSGKPIVFLVPFFVVGFEFTILLAVFGNILGLISQTKLPRFIAQPTYHPSFSCDRYGILASCEAGREKELSRFFESKGARIEIHPPTPIEELGKRG